MLLAQLEADYLAAMKNREEVKKLALNYLLAQAKQKRIDTQAELTDEKIITLLKKEIKSLNESINFLQQAGNKAEEIKIEQEKKQLLQSYLPATLNRSQTQALIENLIQELQLNDLKTQRGRLMKELMAKHKQEIDTSLVNELLNARNS